MNQPSNNKNQWNIKCGKFVALTATENPWFTNIQSETNINNSQKNLDVHIPKKIEHFAQGLHKKIKYQRIENLYGILICLLFIIILTQVCFMYKN